MTALADIKRQLRGLSPDELHALRKAIDALLIVSAPASHDADDREDWVLAVIVEKLAAIGAYQPVSRAYALKRLKASRAIGAFRDKLPALLTFLDEQTRQRGEQEALLKLAIDFLYAADVKWRDQPIMPQTLMQQIDRIPAVLDLQFPGYARAGMLAIVCHR